MPSMSITKKTKPRDFTYEVDGFHIETTSDHKYLGVTINKGLGWKQHVQNITSSAHSYCTLGILRRNISSCRMETKSCASKALVRPKLEYSSAAWNPHQNDHENKLKGAQCQVARFICNNYDRTASVISMLQSLEWESLATWRLFNQCSMFYKFHFGLVNIPFPSCVILSIQQGRSNHTLGYQTIQSRVNMYRYSFFVRTIPT